MNLPEYQRALRTAHSDFKTMVAEATTAYEKALAAAHERFFEEAAEAAEPDYDPVRKR